VARLPALYQLRSPNGLALLGILLAVVAIQCLLPRGKAKTPLRMRLAGNP
jgi:hypothetical protein